MKLLENFPLSDIVYYHIGGHARYVLKVQNTQDLLEALQFIHEKNIDKVQILGLGSNVVIPDGAFEGVVIWLEGDDQSHQILGENRIKVFAGETMDSLIQFSFKNSLIGLQWAGGLPSTVGGAIRGNAGAFGSEIKDSIVEVQAIDTRDLSLAAKTYSSADSSFSYRDSFFKKNPHLVIVSGTFALQNGSSQQLEEAMSIYAKNIEYRLSHHPMEYPSCGSVFKNIYRKEDIEMILKVWPDLKELSDTKWHGKISMAYIINKLGFSGQRIGGAMVSPKHTNYIVNIENAKAEDVTQLIRNIQVKFSETFGFTPEPEVAIL